MADEKDKTSKDEAPPSSAPEVEAEIVGEGGKSQGAGFEGAATDATDAAEAPKKPRRKMRLTVGAVLLAALLGAALAVAYLWPFQSGDPSVVDADAEPPAVVDAAAADSEDNAHEKLAEAQKRPAPADKADNGAKMLDNDFAAPPEPEQKDVATLDDPSGGAPAPDETFLPPVADPNAVEPGPEFRTAATEAAGSSGEGRGQNGSPPDDGAPAMEPEAAQTDVVSPLDDEPAPAEMMAAIADGRKIDNEITALKEAFRMERQTLQAALAEERERSLALGRDVAEMRRSLQEAILARDERVNEEFASLRAAIEKMKNDDGAIAAGRRVAGGLAVGALAQAIERGGPFEAELNAVARFAPDAASIKELRSFASQGAPAIDALKDEFTIAAREGLAAAGRDRAGGFLARLFSRAQSLISIRPAQPRAGDSAVAIMSRAEAAVGRGDLAAALGEIETLPAAAQGAMAAWTRKARARAAVDSALAAMLAHFAAPADE